MNTMLFSLLAGLLPAQVGAALPADSVEALRRAALSAEARYERLSRSLAPITWSGPSGSECDEIVGRFCVRFDSVSKPPAAPQAPGIGRAREDAVEAARRYFAAAPGDTQAAGPLVRMLVRDGRAREAVSAAGAFAALSTDTLWGHLLTGYALHRNGETAAADSAFSAALLHMSADEREAWEDFSWLVTSREKSAVERLPAEARAEYARRLWRLSDPFWATAPNERWIEHLARRVEARLLARLPSSAGALSWGRDQDQLTVRYGTPTATERVGGIGGSMGPAPLVEHWDTAQRAYTPDALLTDGFPAGPPPGAKPVFYAARARSAWAMASVRRVLEPDHQVTRFLDGDDVVLRIDGVFVVDSGTATIPSPRAFAADTALTQLVEGGGTLLRTGDEVRFTASVRAPPGLGFYSVELFDPLAGVAVRARYSLAAELPDQRLRLSDILVTEPIPPDEAPETHSHPALRGLGSLELERGDTLGLYAEVYGAYGGVTVEVALVPAGDTPLLLRAARWIGRTVTGAAPPTDPRVEWSAAVPGGTVPVSLSLPLPEDRRGLQEVVLRVTDAVSGESAESRRLLLIR